MPTPTLAAKAADALKASVKLSNEVIGTMNLIDMNIPVTPGIIKAMRRYLRDIEAYVTEIEGQYGLPLEALNRR